MSELPTGTVTFLFTDVEGSTRLWEEHPDAMKPALARHDAILRDAVESNDGHIVKTTGDGVHAVFADAGDAIVAAADAQRNLQDETWMLRESLHVRMGIHTGAAEHRSGDYYGPAVNRAARIMSAANGGQILTSLATEEVVIEALPPGIELLDLRDHQLRDLARPQRIFQIVADGLPRDFPPIRSIDSFPGNLPPQLTSFVGRDDDVAGIAKALDESRLVTILGAGGMGKTRLAIQVAAELLPRFPDGAWLCELAPARDAESMVQNVASTLSVSTRRGLSLEESVVDFLGPKRLLLVLDNCEQVHAAAGELAASILRACPQVKIVATSRQPIDALGEQQWPLRPLALPDGNGAMTHAGDADAVRLFVDRARSVRPGFTIDEANAAAIGEICRRLDGMPLAIELAAARLSSLGPQQIASLLDERFRMLSGSGRDERHQTLRAAIDWSYSLLDPVSQRVFDRLGVFSGSFDTDAACAVAGDQHCQALDVLEALTSLVEHSMVTADPRPDGTMRYVLLETLRQYATERLGGEVERWRRCHAEHYANFAARAGEGLMTPDEVEWRARVRVELDNLRAGVWYGLESDDDANAVLAADIVARLGWLAASSPWRIGELAEGAIARGVFSDESARYTVHGAAAHLALGAGSYALACDLARDGLRDGIPEGAFAFAPHMTYNALACATAVLGNLDAALQVFEEGIDAVRAAGASAVDELILQGSAGMVEAAYGRTDAGRARSERALPLARATKQPSGLAMILIAFGWSTLDSDPDASLAALDEAIELGRRGASTSSHGVALSMAAQLRCRRGDVGEALIALRETVHVNTDSGDKGMLVTALERSVPVFVDAGQLGTAVTIAAALDSPYGRIGHLAALEQTQMSDAVMRARDRLDAVAYAEARDGGRSMSLDEIVVFALGEIARIERDLV